MTPELTPAQKAKARRAQVILYVAMGILVLGPLVMYVIFGRRK
jgi:hypothetical protein